MECPAGKFADLTALACSSCSSQCSTCKLTPEHCISCPSGLSLQPNATCLLSCDSGLVSVEGACLKCTYPCATCSAATINCTSCSAGYLAGFVCVNICPDSTYPDASTRVCQNCPNQCSLCLSAIQCSTCTSGYYLYSKNLTCLASCPDATFPNISICQPCSQPCSTCDSSGCLSCQGYLFVLHDKQCRLDCPPGTYLTLSSQLTKICSLCG
jgi:proprotein convertase subtilisin/kexin type 5